ncbi:MAG: nucleotidyltransferase family protein [Alphaproteobacteria bacterium]|nr:nucleotidyltransferase family protein [Alphaproteobacteria bacterium]
MKQEIQEFLAFAVGDLPLPANTETLSGFIAWAQREHIMGQVAAVIDAEPGSKLSDICENAKLRSSYDRRMLTYETDRIKRALLGTGVEPILLKGSAYVAEHLFAGVGRRVSDIDILVEESDLEQVEALLKEAGWQPEATTENEYDQRYYRRWMHELPPLRHAVRRTIIDIHHRLLPRTSRLNPDHLEMIKEARAIEGEALRVLSPTDRFIHSAIHVFGDGAMETPARSFLELYYLYKDLSKAEGQALYARAIEVRSDGPVAAALWVLRQYFGLDIADEGQGLPSLRLRFLIRQLAENRRYRRLAEILLYIRSHYMRMPVRQLARHLWHKAIRRA